MLRCIRAYRSAGHDWSVGDVVDSPLHEAWLLRDCRDAWEVITDGVTDAPNRMVTQATPKTRTRKAKAS